MGGREQTRFIEQYEITMKQYHKEFDSPPPQEFWPPSDIRFGTDTHYRWVNEKEFFLLKKPRIRNLCLWVGLGLSPFLAASWSEQKTLNFLNPFDFTGPQFLIFYGICSLLAILLCLIIRKVSRRKGKDSFESVSLSWQELSVLSGDIQRYVEVLFFRLVSKDIIMRKNHRFFMTENGEKAELSDKTELSVVASIKDGKETDIIQNELRVKAMAIQEELKAKGLLESAKSFEKISFRVSILYLSLITMGAIKVFVGIARDKPIGFLLVFILVNICLYILFMRRPARTIAGDRYLQKQINKISYSRTNSGNFDQSDVTPICIHGLSVADRRLSHSVLETMSKTRRNHSYQGNSSIYTTIHTDGGGSDSISGGFGSSGGDIGCGGSGCGGCGGD